MRADLFDFDLPESLIALHPASPRDAARLLVARPPSPAPRERGEGPLAERPILDVEDSPPPRLPNKWGGTVSPRTDGPSSPKQDDSPSLLLDAVPPPLWGRLGGGESQPASLNDHLVRDLPHLLRPGDALVMNDTRVIPAALKGVRARGGTQTAAAVTLIERLDDNRWRALAKPAKRLAIGDTIRFGSEGRVCLAGELFATVAAKGEAGQIDLVFNLSGAYLDEAIAILGDMPLPPYIAGKRGANEQDRRDYQTIFAARDGAVAAPTAGLHFTPGLLARLDATGVTRHFVTLHVGAGTFLPVKAADTSNHKMHAEWGEIAPATAAALNETRAQGGRIVAVGTTSLRLLENAADEGGKVHPFQGPTDIFITPGYRFRTVDVLMTNFHLPRSTLFMLVAAFSGLGTMKAAYSHAVQSGYRFYSYGDATLLFPESPRK